jgi:(p)ppGpp synthase/HD superfamily hydrolase
MTRVLFSPLIERAMRVAARCHRTHNRKASDLPYISHPASVALILIKAGFDAENVLAAALLHDVVEDTGYTPQELAAEFPPQVVESVAALTERKLDADGRKRSWQERKQEHLDQIAAASVEARAIVLSDKLHNLGTMLYDLEAGDEIWSRFGAAPEKILWYHRSMIEQAAGNDDRLNELAEGCRGLLAQLEAAVR